MSIIGTIRERLSHLSKHFTVGALCGDGADRFIDEALTVTGRGEQRQSPLQPRLTICLSIFRTSTIPAVNVVRSLIDRPRRLTPASLK